MPTEMQRARWRGIKRAARAKAAVQPVELSAEFVAEAMAERDRRASREFEQAIFDHPAVGYWTKSRANWINMHHGSWRANSVAQSTMGQGNAYNDCALAGR